MGETVDQEDSEPDSIAYALEEARRSLDNQIEMSLRLNNEALDLMKIILIIAGLLFTVVQLGSQPIPIVYVGFSGLFLILAFACAYFGYQFDSGGFGLHEGEFMKTATLEDPEYVGLSLVNSYSNWVRENTEGLETRNRWIFRSFILISAAIGSMAGILYSI